MPPPPILPSWIFTILASRVGFIQIFYRYVALPAVYRILHGAFLPLGEPLLMAGFVFFGEFFGVTVELIRTLIRKRPERASCRRRARSSGRVTEEVAGYVFHDRGQWAAVGVFECIIEGVENGTVALPPELRQMVYLSRVHARHAMQVISNILDYSKLKAGKFELQVETFELKSLVDDAISMVRHLLHSKPNVQLGGKVNLQHDLYRGSPFHLQQILLNLLSNACKHTNDGSVTVTVEDYTEQARIAEAEARALAAIAAAEVGGRGRGCTW